MTVSSQINSNTFAYANYSSDKICDSLCKEKKSNLDNSYYVHRPKLDVIVELSGYSENKIRSCIALYDEKGKECFDEAKKTINNFDKLNEEKSQKLDKFLTITQNELKDMNSIGEKFVNCVNDYDNYDMANCILEYMKVSKETAIKYNDLYWELTV